METKTFSEQPLRYAIKTAVFGAVLFTIIAVVLNVFPLPVDDDGNDQTELFLIMVLGSEVIVILILFLVRSLMKKTTVTCDSESCDVYTTNFWNTYHKSESLVWSEVTDTNLNEERVDKGAATVFIDIEVRERTYRLLSQYLSSVNAFSGLIDYVNQATPHLNYVWEKTSDFGNRQVIVEVRNFSKVARR